MRSKSKSPLWFELPVRPPLALIGRRPKAPRPRTATVTSDIEPVVVIRDEGDLRVIRGGQQVTTAERREGRSVVAGDEEARIRARYQWPHVARRRQRSRDQSRHHGAADRGRHGRPGGTGVRTFIKRGPGRRRKRVAARYETYGNVDRCHRQCVDARVGETR